MKTWRVVRSDNTEFLIIVDHYDIDASRRHCFANVRSGGGRDIVERLASQQVKSVEEVET
jgi:hypothetical protein